MNTPNLDPASKPAASVNPKISFATDDCEVFARYPASVNWAQVSTKDQEQFKSIRVRLKKLSELFAGSPAAPVPLKAETSHPTPNGRSPKEIWCCVYPESFGSRGVPSIGDKEHGLQAAFLAALQTS